MVGTSRGRRASAAALALFCAGFLSTCDFLTADIFPSWFSYVEARVDLRSVMKANGLGDLAVPLNVEYAPYNLGAVDYSKVLVIAAGNATKRLFLLDPNTLQLKNTVFDPAFEQSLASAANGFMCGTRIVDPAAPTIITNSFAWTNPSGVRLYRVGIGGTGINYVVDINSPIQFKMTKIDWNFSSTLSSCDRDVDTTLHSYYLADADYCNGFSVLVVHQTEYNGRRYANAYSRPDDLHFAGAGSIFSSAFSPEHTGPFPVSEEKAWLTEGGPVAFLRGDRDTDRIIRYRYGTGQFSTTFGDFASGFAPAQEIDSIPFDEDGELRIFSFEPSGKWWFVYNARTGYLYKLRTWWK
jgi:hypothetical protein